ncbi:hypothetical protein MRBLMI12_002908 [Microbacterium sp. LMI12-1-1.1]|uniref:Uncharacterized protein n=1 Tax=Microbacterium sp. LWS13-1.2 TaxID=3135264 RepID=A0AAU6S6T4_9MICO
MTDNRSSTTTVVGYLLWTLFALFLAVGAWLGIALPLLFGATGRLPFALLALAAAVTAVSVNTAVQYRSAR